MQGAGYWINGDQIIDVTFSSHIDYLSDHPSEFGFSEQEVKEAFRKHGENFGAEGGARAELVKAATTRGGFECDSTEARWTTGLSNLIDSKNERTLSYLLSNR